MKRRLRWCLWLPVAWISACTPSSDQLYESGAPAVRDWYRQTMQAPPPRAALPALRRPQRGRFSESALRALRRDFEVVPNTPLILYVFPHLSAQGAPIPGYATQFFLFERPLLVKTPR